MKHQNIICAALLAVGIFGAGLALRNGIITFPANALCVALGDDLYYANPSQQFRLDLTTCGLTPIHDDAPSEADAPLHDLCGRRVAAPAPGIYLRQGKKILVRP